MFHGFRVAPNVGDSVKWPLTDLRRLGLADHDCPGGAQAPHQLGVLADWLVLPAAAKLSRVAGQVDVVLDRDRHAKQRTRPSPASRSDIGRICLPQRLLGKQHAKGIERRLGILDSSQGEFDQLP